jgi:plastocyanin
MANTDVTLNNDGGTYVPSTDSVAVVSGDTVSFSTTDGKPGFAFFSPDAIAVLSPKPTNPFPIAAGKKAAFTFSSSKPGAYSAYFAHDAGSAPARFPTGTSQTLRLEVASANPPGFPGPADTVGTGHGG